MITDCANRYVIFKYSKKNSLRVKYYVARSLENPVTKPILKFAGTSKRKAWSS